MNFPIHVSVSSLLQYSIAQAT